MVEKHGHSFGHRYDKNSKYIIQTVYNSYITTISGRTMTENRHTQTKCKHRKVINIELS
jgi:hypothetical protein